MTQIRDPRLRTLLAQPERNANYGKNAAAEMMYRQIIDEAPQAEEGWLGLARVTTDADEKRAAYERALDLSPENPAAVAGLAVLDGRPVPPEAAAALAALEPSVEETRPSTVTVAEEVAPAPMVEEATYTLTCYRHPERLTSLRCYNCNRPICISCARKTPVGYICPDCQRQAEDAFYNSRPLDYLIAAVVSLPISLLVGYLLIRFFVGSFFFFLIVFFISGAVGGFIGRITKRAIGGRRGRYLPGLVVAMMVLGVTLPAGLLLLLGGVNLFAMLGLGIFLFVAGGAAYWQMR